MLSLGSRLQEPLAFILVSVPGCGLESFVGKFFFLEWFGLLSHVSSLRLFSGHSGLVLTLSTNDAASASLPSSHSMVAYMSFWATYPLAVVVRHIFCGFVFLFFPLGYVALWDSKLPTDLAGRGLLTVWKLLLICPRPRSSPLHSQDRSLSLNLLSIFSSFIFCPTSFWREWAAFLGSWCPPPAFSCSVEVDQHSNVSLKNL